MSHIYSHVTAATTSGTFYTNVQYVPPAGSTGSSACNVGSKLTISNGSYTPVITLDTDGTIRCKGINGVDVTEMQTEVTVLVSVIDRLVALLQKSGVKDENGNPLQTATELIEQQKTISALKD